MLVLVPAAHAADSPWSWADRAPKLLDVSCSAAARCVAVGSGGYVLHSDAQGTGPQAWSRVGIARADSLTGVTCDAARCIAVSSGTAAAPVSRVFTSADGGATWTDRGELPQFRGDLGRTQAGTDVACDPAGTCTIAGPRGGVWQSADGATWQPVTTADTGTSIERLACPATQTCVLVGPTASFVVRGTNADRIPSPTTGELRAVACESRQRCVASDSLGHVYPIAADFRRWGTGVDLPGVGTTAVALSCASDGCLGITGTGGAVRQVSADRWRLAKTGTKNLVSLSCVDATCVAAGPTAAWYGSTDAGATWTLGNEVAGYEAADCPGGTCVAVGKKDIGVSASAGDLWKTTVVAVDGVDLGGVSCGDGFPACIALGKSRTLVTADGGQTWQNRLPAGAVTGGPEHFACMSVESCVGAGGGGMYTTLDGSRSGWWMGSVQPAAGEMMADLDCPTAVVCVLATKVGIYRGTRATPTSTAWSWTATDADPNEIIVVKGKPAEGLSAVSCPTDGFCTAVGFGGQIFTTTDPQLLHWTGRVVGDPVDLPPFLAVDCATTRVCVAGGQRGYVATTDDGWATNSLDQLPSPTGVRNDGPAIADITCSRTRCLTLGGAFGTVLVGTRAPAAET